MIRITSVSDPASGPTLKVEGKLVGEWLDELVQACDQHLPSYPRLRLDLSAVTFIDGEGVNLLRRLHARGIRLSACSGLVAELLRRENP